MRRGVHVCDGCGAPMARVQLRPPVYRCGACAPLAPMRRLSAWQETFPGFEEHMGGELARLRRMDERPGWCFVGCQPVCVAFANLYELTFDDIMFFMVEAAAMFTWRAAKAVYRLHPSLLAELLDTPVAGPLPVESLLRLPVWCPYVECDLPVTWGCNPEEARIVGFYAFLDTLTPFGAKSEAEAPLLRLVLDIEAVDGRLPSAGDACHVQLSLLPGLTVEQSCADVDERIAAMLERKTAAGHDTVSESGAAAAVLPAAFYTTAKRLLSVLLYLCAENAEADKRPAPLPCRVVRGARGERVYEAPAPVIIRCGQHIGARLKEAREEYERTRYLEPRGTVAPHVRAAHWHHFWKGPRDGPRELVLRWLPPILVKMGAGDAPPATTLRVVE